MLTRHFLKTLMIFAAMIVLGIIGLFASSYFNNGGEKAPDINSGTQVAK
ncbi:MAG: hypothetical protein UU82_C0032G0007 [Candidatus Nomurabacteria bacterium GW2011_GWC2_41_8]|uniref:Uncharacterized protein n=1 Tax=Candidatus Nomurabacteria bacterium GW2011_GWC2_41_8 TaxID=1618755 RepID=A0A0G0XET9_9BACT|nr:MAG: hypothetical protein UU82_C0032G0007 [Candidatus Nomurabacteria bacterium GW2011_GWC2_41_8]